MNAKIRIVLHSDFGMIQISGIQISAFHCNCISGVKFVEPERKLSLLSEVTWKNAKDLEKLTFARNVMKKMESLHAKLESPACSWLMKVFLIAVSTP